MPRCSTPLCRAGIPGSRDVCLDICVFGGPRAVYLGIFRCFGVVRYDNDDNDVSDSWCVVPGYGHRPDRDHAPARVGWMARMVSLRHLMHVDVVSCAVVRLVLILLAHDTLCSPPTWVSGALRLSRAN